MERFILQKSTNAGYFVCTDTKNKITCIFKKHDYNNDQKFTLLEDFDPENFMQIAKYTREMAEWLRENHYEKIF